MILFEGIILILMVLVPFSGMMMVVRPEDGVVDHKDLARTCFLIVLINSVLSVTSCFLGGYLFSFGSAIMVVPILIQIFSTVIFVVLGIAFSIQSKRSPFDDD